jgi:cbb3-type cytochrome oxidase maturation protein
MTILFLLIPIGLALGLVGLGAFSWCLRSGQYEDLAGAAVRIFHDEDGPPKRQEQRGAHTTTKETS